MFTRLLILVACNVIICRMHIGLLVIILCLFAQQLAELLLFAPRRGWKRA